MNGRNHENLNRNTAHCRHGLNSCSTVQIVAKTPVFGRGFLMKQITIYIQHIDTTNIKINFI